VAIPLHGKHNNEASRFAFQCARKRNSPRATLEKLARALEIPLYQLFYDGEEPPKLPNLLKRNSPHDTAWGSTGKEARYLNKLRRLLCKTEEGDRKLLLHMAQKMSNR